MKEATLFSITGSLLGSATGFGNTGSAPQPPASNLTRQNLTMAEDLTSVQFSEEIQNEANMFFQKVCFCLLNTVLVEINVLMLFVCCFCYIISHPIKTYY